MSTQTKILESEHYAAIEVARGVDAALKELMRDIGSNGVLKTSKNTAGDGYIAEIEDVGIVNRTPEKAIHSDVFGEGKTEKEAKASLLKHLIHPQTNELAHDAKKNANNCLAIGTPEQRRDDKCRYEVCMRPGPSSPAPAAPFIPEPPGPRIS